jgi:hypothetical protein
MNVKTGLASAAVLAGAVLLTGAARADRLDAQLGQQMPDLIGQLKAKYKNVGVLRFRVQEAGKKESFNAPLAGRLAERVENLLVLGNGPDESKALGVVHDAGHVAARHKIAAWYTNPADRKKLFGFSYPMAWGNKSVTPDAFLTGKVTLSKDRKATSLTLECFDKAEPARLRTLTTVKVGTDRAVLRDLGYNLVLSKRSRQKLLALKRAGEDEEDEQIISKVNNQQPADGSKPAEKEKADETKAEPGDVGGVSVELLVDGKPMTIREGSTQGDNVKWQVESPKPGSSIAFALRNKTDKKMAVVLRLNGVNTLAEAKDEPEVAPKWVIPAKKAYLIKGFYPLEGKQQANARGKAKGKPARRDGQENENAGEADKQPDKKQPDKKQPDKKQPDKQANQGLTVKPFKVLVGEDAARIGAQMGEKKGLIEVTVFAEGPERQGQQRSLTSPKGLPPSKEKQARASYLGLRSALLKSNKLKTTVVAKREGGLVVKREVIVPDDAAVKAEQAIRIVEFPNAQMVAHAAIKVVPAEAEVKE